MTDLVYVHTPFCLGKCRYCALYSRLYDPLQADLFLDAFDRELKMVLANGACDSTPRAIYLGGGTPTALASAQLARLCAIVCARLSLAKLVEWSVEANPATLTPSKVAILAGAGVNRISIGAQSFDTTTLKGMGRPHGPQEIAEAVFMARSGGIANVGLDLIAHYPGVADSTWRVSLEAALALRPDHVSVYALTVEEASELGRMFADDPAVAPVNEARELRVLRDSEKVLAQAGFARYEYSNYALPGRECRYNLACWQGDDYLGLGPAAASRTGLQRRVNLADTAAYSLALRHGEPPPGHEETLSPLDDAAERMVFGFRLATGVDVARFAPDHSTLARWQEILARLSRQGVTRQQGAHWVLTPRGRNLADAVARELL